MMPSKAGLPATEVKDASNADAVDNRVSWIPDEFPATKKWEDGGEYPIPAFGKGAMLRQISPGEGELVPGTPPAEEVEEEAPAPKRGKGYNPALESLAEEA